MKSISDKPKTNSDKKQYRQMAKGYLDKVFAQRVYRFSPFSFSRATV
jgi:hypothetical protein